MQFAGYFLHIFLGNSMRRSIIGGDLNLPQADWKGIA